MGYGSIERADMVRAEHNCAQYLQVPAYLPDPLGEDRADDPRRHLSDREIARVVFLAAETGHRFAREGRDADPAAWMFAPRRVFDGEAPVEACASRHGFVAAMVLHAVWPDLDVDPAVIGHLLDVDGEDEGDGPAAPAALYTAVVLVETFDSMRRTFFAVTAVDIDEARTRLVRRVGLAAAENADLRRGFDPLEPLARSLLPDTLCDLLGRFDGPAPAPTGFEVFVDCRVIA